jgi:hypothetical protein
MFKEMYGKLTAKFGKRNVIIAMVVVGVLVLGGITRSIEHRVGNSLAERAIEASTGGKVNVDSDNGSVTVKTDQGTWSTSDKLPSDWPTDVPVYPGATVQGSVAAQGQTAGHYVGLVTSDDAAKAIAWYKGELAAKGWKVTAEVNTAQGNMLSAEKDSRNLVVVVSAQDGKTTISLTVATK